MLVFLSLSEQMPGHIILSNDRTQILYIIHNGAKVTEHSMFNMVATSLTYLCATRYNTPSHKTQDKSPLQITMAINFQTVY
jgi:hypothetical protein